MFKSIILFGLLFFNTTVFCQDWSDWRGSKRDGLWNSVDVPLKFKSDQLTVKWEMPIGSGYSGPTVSKGKVFITDLLEKPGQTEGVICLNQQTGKKLWEYRYECNYGNIGYPAGPRASVNIDDDKVFSLGTVGNLFCFDSETGKIIWQKDLNKEYEIRLPIWGISAAPLIYEDILILHIGGSKNACIIALDKKTGREIWRNLEDGASYSAPVLAGESGKEVLIVWTEDNLNALNPITGELFWKFPWKIKMAMTIATPVIYKDFIFCSSFYSGSLLVRAGKEFKSATKVWQRCGESERKTDAFHCVMNTPVILNDYIYGVDSYGELRCLELKTGNRIWENQTAVIRNRWANIHFVQNGRQTWMFNEHGELLITELSDSGFKELSRAKVINPTTKQLPRGVVWSHPAFVDKNIFIRNDEKIICAEIL